MRMPAELDEIFGRVPLFTLPDLYLCLFWLTSLQNVSCQWLHRSSPHLPESLTFALGIIILLCYVLLLLWLRRRKKTRSEHNSCGGAVTLVPGLHLC